MRRFLVAAAVVALGLTLALPAAAGHFGPSRGRHVFVGGRAAFVAPAPRLALSLGFGYPAYSYSYGPYYPPAPFYGPVYYEPYGTVVGPVCAYPVWVAPHFAWRGGVRFFVAGHWAR